MKITILTMLTLILLSCGGTKEINETPNKPQITEVKNPEINTQINDIWVAETFFGQRFEPNGDKMPQLEIHIKGMHFAGNDGCNSFSGTKKKLDNENVIFGNVAATKMACQDMTVPAQFNKALIEARLYKIQKLRLYLFDGDLNELMVLKKVD